MSALANGLWTCWRPLCHLPSYVVVLPVRWTSYVWMQSIVGLRHRPLHTDVSLTPYLLRAQMHWAG